MENNIVNFEVHKTELEKGIATGKAIAKEVTADGTFDAAMEKTMEWADKYDLDHTVGNAVALIIIGCTRAALGDEVYDTPVEDENGEFVEDRITMGLNSFLNRVGLELKDGEVVTKAAE